MSRAPATPMRHADDAAERRPCTSDSPKHLADDAAALPAERLERAELADAPRDGGHGEQAGDGEGRDERGDGQPLAQGVGEAATRSDREPLTWSARSWAVVTVALGNAVLISVLTTAMLSALTART